VALAGIVITHVQYCMLPANSYEDEVRWPNSSLFHWRGGCGKGTCGGDHVILPSAA
jgi:hypothetical protein